jgi:asparagine synthase (glutamine-hydrolysing)
MGHKASFEMEIARRQAKYLLRKLAYRYIPMKIVDRPKRGFEVPIANWLKGPLRPWANAAFHDSESFKNIPLVQDSFCKLLNTHKSGERRARRLLWRGKSFWMPSTVCQARRKN